ncbi:aspartate kinase [Candidatus Micrarchaeota archaeon]|nr:aspartate kinase [Candidatus Micrarchaeota archaeon]
MLVQKFGGGILSSAADYGRTAAIVRASKPYCVVVSAMGGVTDELISLLHAAREGKSFSNALFALKEKHRNALEGNYPDGGKVGGHFAAASKQIDSVFSDIEKILTGVGYTREYSGRLYALVLSRGEFLSAHILSSHLPDFSAWPSENGFAAKGDFLNSRCDFERTVKPPERSVVTGFYGMGGDGEVRLFGRGGGDYSASCVARAIGAEKVEFWKNVDGFMTADPRVAGSASLVREMCFEEASEVCRFGAKILHPCALEPLWGTGAVAEVRNFLAPQKRGTLISEDNARKEIASIAGKTGIAVLSVSGEEFVGSSGIASAILSQVAQAGIPVDVIATAQANMSFTIDGKDLEGALGALGGMEGISKFSLNHKAGLSLVGVVGAGLKRHPRCVSRVFSSLAKAGVGVEMVSQGAGEIDLSLVVPQGDYETAVRAIHDEFFGNAAGFGAVDSGVDASVGVGVGEGAAVGVAGSPEERTRVQLSQ